MGLTMASTRILEAVMCFWSISLWDCKRLSPVNFLRRAALRKRILGVDVSGSNMNITKKIGPAAHRISHNDHLQPFAVTANPDNSGPSAGPQYAALTHATSAYGKYSNAYISCRLAAPFAKHGLPKKPCRNRRTSKPAKLSTSAVGSDRMVNIAIVAA